MNVPVSTPESRTKAPSADRPGSALLAPGRVGTLRLPNRIARSATCESMATADGIVTDELIELHRRLAAGRVGLNKLGHAFVHPRGQATPRQIGLHDDSMRPGLSRLTAAVHEQGGRIFAQLAHAGSQTKVDGLVPLAPSPVPNALTSQLPVEATADDIEEAVAAFGEAARRARESGFDGVEIHAANGYLISEFSSSFANKRSDKWGGSADRRDTFILSVYGAVRSAVGPDFPVSVKLGMVDLVEGGTLLEESVERAAKLAKAGLDAIEVSCGVMTKGTDSCHDYVAVDRNRALRDHLYFRMFNEPAEEAYWAPWALSLRDAVPDLTIMLVGGMRSSRVMEELVARGVCDIVCVGRPFVRQPDLVIRLATETAIADCTSCNICLEHDGHDPLRCWRTPRYRLLSHAARRLAGVVGR